MSEDLVNRPSHYTSHESGIECIDIAEHLGFNLGNAVKYLWRAGKKAGVEAELDRAKALWYVRRQIKKTLNECHNCDGLALKKRMFQVAGTYTTDTTLANLLRYLARCVTVRELPTDYMEALHCCEEALSDANHPSNSKQA